MSDESEPVISGQIRDTFLDTFLDSVIRLDIDPRYEGERSALKAVLSSNSGWNHAIASIEPVASSDFDPRVRDRTLNFNAWQILLDLFVDAGECDEAASNKRLELRNIPHPSQHLGLRLNGLNYEQAAAIYKQIQARFDVRTGPTTMPPRLSDL